MIQNSAFDKNLTANSVARVEPARETVWLQREVEQEFWSEGAREGGNTDAFHLKGETSVVLARGSTSA